MDPTMSDYFMKRPCIHCPFRKDVKPFLHPDRGAELANHAQNPYNSFPCHKTTVSVEELGIENEHNEGDMVAVETSKECAGFITLQINEGADTPEGFEPAFDIVYECAEDMANAYENQEP